MSDQATISENPTQALGDVARAAGGVVAPGTERPDPGPKRNERGQFQGKKSDEEVRAILEAEFPDDFKKHSPMGKVPKVQPEAGDIPAEGASEPKREAEAAVDRELSKAIDFLKRDKVPASVLSKLTPDEAKAYAKERKALVVAHQQAQQRIAELEKAKPTIQTTPEPGSRGSQPSEVPALGSLEEAVKGIRDLYGDEAAAPLEKAFSSMQTRLDAIEQTFNRATQAQTQARVNEAREALQERFPQYEDDDSFQEAIKVAAALEQAGVGNSATLAGTKALLEKAAQNLDWTPIKVPKPNKEDDELAALRANGTATSRSKPGQKPALSKDEKLEMAARFALDPTIPVEDARRRLAAM